MRANSVRRAIVAALGVVSLAVLGCAQGTVPPPEPTSPGAHPVPTTSPSSMETVQPVPHVNAPQEPAGGASDAPHSN